MSEHWISTASAIGLIILLATAMPAQACGPYSDCMVGHRTYRIALPAEDDGRKPLGAIIVAHGYRGSAAGVMANDSLRGLARKLGVALVAVQTVGDDWSIPGAPSDTLEADELGYFDAVRADLISRFRIRPERLVVAGFSAGGMMVWTLAYRRGGDYAGFVAIAGTFWRPLPAACNLPVASIIHFHGKEDRVVPLEGRPISDAHQGAVPDVLKMYTAFGGFSEPVSTTLADLNCTLREARRRESLHFCLFGGGHRLNAAHLQAAWHWFEARSHLQRE